MMNSSREHRIEAAEVLSISIFRHVFSVFNLLPTKFAITGIKVKSKAARTETAVFYGGLKKVATWRLNMLSFAGHHSRDTGECKYYYLLSGIFARFKTFIAPLPPPSSMANCRIL